MSDLPSGLEMWLGYPRRLLGDGRQACLFPLAFGRARITVGKADALIHDHGY